MESPKGPQNPELKPNLKERMQALGNLSKKFGGSAKIPEEELTSIGYIRRITDDGMIHLSPQELKVENVSLKDKERPFERIAVELTTADQSFRFIPREQRKLLLNRLQGVEYAFYPNWHDGTSIQGPIQEIDPRLHNIRAFSADFLNFLKDQGIDGKEVPQTAAEFLLFNPLPVRRENNEGVADPDDPNDFLHDQFLSTHADSEDGSVSSLDARNMYDELTRLSGYFGDVTALTDDFKKRLAQPTIIDGQTGPEPDEQLAEYLNSLNIHTYADVIKYVFPKYLKYAGLDQMAVAVEASSELTTLPESLTSMDTSNNFREEEGKLRQQLKTTPEERNTISGRLKEIDVAKKKRMQIRNGVIDYFDSPQVYAEIGRRKVREAQDFLLAGKGKRTDSALIYLDAWFNPELDKDPGAFSGDCTVGKPLPFNRADILAYNVKVFTSQEEHIGNMYLLVTKEAGVEAEGFVEDSKVWHFDAMQIPKTGIDWKVSVPAIFNSLANAAMAKGDIEVITVNSEDHLISNYDYIQEAVKKYWEETSKEETEVDIPQFIPEEDYSNFQGNGEALVLWRKEVTIA